MEKIILAVCAVLVLSSSAIAQTVQKTERYYVGMGVQLATIDENISALYGEDGRKYSNEKGQLTGLVVLRQILKGGPADKAGLKDMDVLLRVDRLIVTSLPGGFAIAHLTSRNEGDLVNLRVRRIDENGNSLKEFDVDVVLEKIDRVSWVPLDLSLGGGFGSQDGMVSYSSMVSENKTIGKFIYRYEISNGTPKPVILNSTIFSLLFRKGESDTTQYQLKLDPGGTTTIVLESDDFPASEVPSPTRAFSDADSDPEKLKYFKENYPDIGPVSYTDPSGKLWLNDMGTSMHLFVPEIWVVTLMKENELFWKR